MRSSFVVAGVLVGLVGCNAILDNQPGDLTSAQTSETTPTPTVVAPTPDPAPVELPVATPADAGDPDTGTSSKCRPNEHACYGQCVSDNDPAYGCGDETCAPCSLGHATATCAAKTCVISECDKGYADCDLSAATGCEGDLSKATSCGTCNTVCAPAAPLCAPGSEAGSFSCSTGCTPIAPLLCGATCVDPSTSDNNCGGCNVKCPTVANGTAVCTNASCGFTCKQTFHACGATCASDTDPKMCGAGCAVCPDPPNATGTCAAGACGIACKAGFADCNVNPADGCESELAKDNASCGACWKACAAGTVCSAGACVATPDGGGP